MIRDEHQIPVVEQTNEQWLAAYDAAEMSFAASRRSSIARFPQAGNHVQPLTTPPAAQESPGSGQGRSAATLRAHLIDKIPSVSWWHIVTELERHGYTHAAIAAAIGVARTTVQGWKNQGASPRHVDGECLLVLWCVVTEKTRDDVPRKTGDILSAARVR